MLNLRMSLKKITNFNGDTSFILSWWCDCCRKQLKKSQQVRADYFWELESALTKFGIQLPAMPAAIILWREQVGGMGVAVHK